MWRGKDEETYVDDLVCHEFTPPEGMKECLQLSVPRQEIGCADVRVLGEIRKTFRDPGEGGRVIEVVEYELQDLVWRGIWRRLVFVLWTMGRAGSRAGDGEAYRRGGPWVGRWRTGRVRTIYGRYSLKGSWRVWPAGRGTSRMGGRVWDSGGVNEEEMISICHFLIP